MGRSRCITHPSATRHQESKLSHAAVRLACVRHAASVQSEPGSNSSLKFSTTSPLRASSSVLSKRMSQPKTHCCVSIGWTLCIAWDRPQSLQRKASTQFTCAHCQRSLACHRLGGGGLKHFASGEPAILHRKTTSSTPCEAPLGVSSTLLSTADVWHDRERRDGPQIIAPASPFA